MRLLIGILATLAWLIPAAARASEISSLSFFGDSLTDEGRNGRTAPVIWAGVLRNDLSITAGTNYAIGGAVTSSQPSAQFGDSSYLGQVNSFVASGTPVSAGATAGIWIGTNNVWIGSAQHIAPATIAAGAGQDVQTGITSLVSAGVHNVLLLGVYDLSLTNAFTLAGANTIAVRDAAAAASAQYNARLAALSAPGATITFFNIATFINHLQANAAAYGFQQILPLQPGAACNGTCQQTSIFTDTIHLTARTQALIGDYVASGDPIYNNAPLVYGAIADNIANAAVVSTLPSQLAAEAAQTFQRSLLDRLDATRDLPFAGVDFRVPSGVAAGRSAYGAPRSPSPWSVYAYATGTAGDIGRTGAASTTQGELETALGGFTAGIEYRPVARLRFGAAVSIAQVDSNLRDTVGASEQLESYQGALYASYAEPRFFADAVATGGGANLNQTRYGTFGAIASSPRGETATAAGRVGYLVPAGPLRIGPVGGAFFGYTSIDARAEGGDPLYAVATAQQNLYAAFGSVGLEARLAEPLAGPFTPFVAVTYDRQFVTRAQPIASTLADLPAQQLPTTFVSAGVDAVRIAFGSSFAFGPNWYGTLTAFALVGQQEVIVGGGSLGVGYRF